MNSSREYVLKRSLNLCGVSKTRWDRVLAAFSADEKSVRAVDLFLNESDSHALFMVVSGNDSFIATREIPSLEKLKRKCIVVSKMVPGASITAENVRGSLVFMELNRCAVENLSGVCNSVYHGVFEGQIKQRKCSELVRNEFIDQLQVLMR